MTREKTPLRPTQKRHRRTRAKGRRLQVSVAQTLARALNLTIIAIPPTPVGERKGVRYVAEGDGGDLMVRPSGKAGADVALMSDKARALIAIDGVPFYIECKNVEKATRALFNPATFRLLWAGRTPGPLRSALRQAERGLEATKRIGHPVAIFTANRWPTLVVAPALKHILPHLVIYLKQGEENIITTLDAFADALTTCAAAGHALRAPRVPRE
jgi:hypothetical protein